jgi:hypothetical protein
MRARKDAIEREQVAVRHIVAGKRKDITHLESLLKAPFPILCGSFQDGGSKDISIHGYATGRFLIAARFARQPWAALCSNASSAEEIFQANASCRRLEIVWLGCRPGVGWFFKLNRAGKPVVDFAQAEVADAASTCKLVGVAPGVLKKGESGEQAVARLCKHFGIARPLPEIRASEDGFEVIGAAGRPLKTGLRGYVRIDGPEVAEGDSEAADALAEAIDGCDAEGIRAAIAQGASLTAKLPDTSMSPLLSALYKFDEPGWKECVELLLELGCPINGVKKEPPIVVCAGDHMDELLARKTVELLVAHGADVNAADREGTTALFECVTNGYVELARLLMPHGADPTLKDKNGMSALEWVRKRYNEETGFKSRTEYAELLSVLTGQPVAKPQIPTLRPELQAENDRFKLCLQARRRLAVMPPNLVDGSPPRYERVGFYLDFSSYDDPSYSTEKEARYWSESFAEARCEPPENAGDATDAAIRLVSLRHFQFAGALDPRPFIVPAGELALAYFRARARASRASDDSAWLEIPMLLHGLLLCALAGSWQTFKQICNAVRPRLMSADTTDEDSDDYAQVLFLFVSGYRDRALPKAAALEQAIQKRRSRRPRLLLDIRRAVGAGREIL